MVLFYRKWLILAWCAAAGTPLFAQDKPSPFARPVAAPASTVSALVQPQASLTLPPLLLPAGSINLPPLSLPPAVPSQSLPTGSKAAAQSVLAPQKKEASPFLSKTEIEERRARCKITYSGPATVSFKGEGGEVRLKFKNSGTPCLSAASGDQAWVNAMIRSNANEVVLTVSPSATDRSREASVSIVAGNTAFEVVVYQEPGGYEEFSFEEEDSPAATGSITLTKQAKAKPVKAAIAESSPVALSEQTSSKSK